MEIVEKKFAIIEEGIVKNAIVGEALAIVQALLPDAQIIEVTEETGSAFIDGPFVDGVFLAPKPFESWTMDIENKRWQPPVAMPSLEPGFFAEWNEADQNWDLKEIPIA